ncbi:DUF2254 domain-containing protein [Leucothrix arctica]|uniref:DUF2254 domain-containing protein n=1 Tax=Leucothrix arctica TaxID=1481894 RepID=A0A317CIK1_9GAMM|nr:DUF2254 domain-containing protein [Leucothrix arctica]PWQ98388.1 DUF2254 domain-containing protein [Leucothrix arctica]
MKTRIRHYLEVLSTAIWMVPLAFLIGSIILAFLNFYLDKTLIARHVQFPDFFLYFNDSENIRTMLSVSGSSILGVAGVSFSITIASLTLASQQFGSRLLRNFMMDRFNQVVLGIFIGTFLYCIMMLQFTSSMDLNKTTPIISMVGLLILVITSLLMLVFFIHHIAVSIQADTVIADVNGTLQAQSAKLFPEEWSEKKHLPDTPPADLQADLFNTDASPMKVRGSGYLQGVDHERLIKLVNDKDIAIKLTVKPGDFLIKNSVIGYCLASDAQKEDFENEIVGPVNDRLLVGSKATAEQDPEFPVRQLVEVAVRALSPGINDPFTAITCIDRLGDNIAFLINREFPSDHHFDEEGRLRLLTKPFTFEGIVEASFNQIRQHGRNDVSVTIHLLDTLLCLAHQASSDEQAKAINTQVNALYSTSNENFNAQKDRDDIKAKYKAINQCLEKRFKLDGA